MKKLLVIILLLSSCVAVHETSPLKKEAIKQWESKKNKLFLPDTTSSKPKGKF